MNAIGFSIMKKAAIAVGGFAIFGTGTLITTVGGTLIKAVAQDIINKIA